VDDVMATVTYFWR